MSKFAKTFCTAAILAVVFSGCVISIDDHGHHHPDRCYDCHYSWEIDRVSVDIKCAEFEITITSGGYWYKPVGADDSEKKFHLLKAGDSGTILGPEAPTAQERSG